MARLFKKISFVAIAAMVLATTPSSAKVLVNSVCSLKNTESRKSIQQEGDISKKFPLASVSKVVTTLWAIEKLGIDYRHKTILHLTPTTNGGLDIHIEGSRDPIFGRNLSYFLISELNRMTVTHIERLTFDENFLLEWLAEESPFVGGATPRYATIEEQAQSVQKNLVESFATAINSSAYSRLRKKAAEAQVFMMEQPHISIRNVGFVPKSQFQRNSLTVSVVLQSAPLHTILKRMNNQSNNYIADNLYWNLGGTAAFNVFAANTLNATQDQIVFYNGSGNNEGTTTRPIYNEASCEMMIKALYSLNQKLVSQGRRLSDVLAVADKDSDSTVKDFGGVASGAMTAKTGSVNKAQTLAGSVSTKEGEFFFVILLHTDVDQNSSDRGIANQLIKNKVGQLINNHSGPKKINYEELITLPFDQGSYLSELTAIGTSK